MGSLRLLFEILAMSVPPSCVMRRLCVAKQERSLLQQIECRARASWHSLSTMILQHDDTHCTTLVYFAWLRRPFTAGWAYYANAIGQETHMLAFLHVFPLHIHSIARLLEVTLFLLGSVMFDSRIRNPSRTVIAICLHLC